MKFWTIFLVLWLQTIPTASEAFGATPEAPWVETGPLPIARERHTATLLRSGKVLVVGGWNGGILSRADIYDPNTGLWADTDHLATARYLHSATFLPSGEVLIAGGRGSRDIDNHGTHSLSSAELYNPSTGLWAPAVSLNEPRDLHTATLLPSGEVLVVGGVHVEEGVIVNYLSSTEIYDRNTDRWTLTDNHLAGGRSNHTATLLASGKVLVTGGMDDEGTTLVRSEIYDPDTRMWSNTGDLITARQTHTATLLPSGKVLIAGGVSQQGDALSSAEIYDPITGSWTGVGVLNTARKQHQAALLPSGKVLVIGGNSTGNVTTLANAEVYDSADDTWTDIENLITARVLHSVTLLHFNKLLVAGGRAAAADIQLSSAEILDLDTTSWISAGDFGESRAEILSKVVERAGADRLHAS